MYPQLSAQVRAWNHLTFHTQAIVVDSRVNDTTQFSENMEENLPCSSHFNFICLAQSHFCVYMCQPGFTAELIIYCVELRPDLGSIIFAYSNMAL